MSRAAIYARNPTSPLAIRNLTETVDFSFDDELEHLHLNPVRKGSAKPPEDWREPNHDRLAWETATIAGIPIQVEHVRLR